MVSSAVDNWNLSSFMLAAGRVQRDTSYQAHKHV
jgi:hypothetical protein